MFTLPLLFAAALPTAELAPTPRSAEVSARAIRAARSRETFNTKPELVRDVSVHWGTAWAALGLLQTLPTAARAADDDVAAKQVELKKGDKIIFFGDSLTELAGKEEPKKHVTKGYVRTARESLQEKHKDKGIAVDWVATGGHTVPDLLKRVEKDVIAKKPTVVVIQIGCNDARRIPKDTFKAGLEELVDKLQKEKIQVVLCSLTIVGEKHDGTNKDDAKLDEFAAVARDRQGQERAAERPPQGVRGTLEEAQRGQQRQRHPDLRRQPLQRRRPQVRRGADAQEVQVNS